MNSRRGSVLVEVLVMSVLLMLLATGLMRIVFMNHTVVVKVQRSSKYRAAVDACMNQMEAQWAANNNGVCQSAPGSCSVDGYTIRWTCGANNQVVFQLDDSSW